MARLLVMTVLAISVAALPSAGWAYLCEGDLVATGTPAGQYQIRLYYGEPRPEWTQLAAFAAAVVPEQQDYAYDLAKRRLLDARRIGDDELPIFEAMFVDMRQANAAAATSAKIMTGTVGGVLGLLTGDVDKGIAGAVGGGAAATALLSFPVKLTIDSGFEAAARLVLDKLVSEPCFMSAGDALAELEAR